MCFLTDVSSCSFYSTVTVIWKAKFLSQTKAEATKIWPRSCGKHSIGKTKVYFPLSVYTHCRDISFCICKCITVRRTPTNFLSSHALLLNFSYPQQSKFSLFLCLYPSTLSIFPCIQGYPHL